MAFTIPRPRLALPALNMMTAVNLLRLIVFFLIVLLSLIVLGLSANFAEILVPSDLTRFVSVGLFISATTLVILTTVFLLGIFRTYVYAAQTRVELAWLGFLAVLWMALAIFLSLSADVEIDCSDGTGAIEENQSVGMSAAEFDAEYRAIEACSFINAILLVGWFLLLLSCAIAHHMSGHQHVWSTPVADYGWFDNPVGSKQRQRALHDRLRSKAVAGLTGEFSSSEEEVRGRARVRSRVRERSRDVAREKAAQPVTPFQPFYDPPRRSIDRPRPLRASTQPIIPVAVSGNKPMPPTPYTPTTPTRPGPPVRTGSAPRLRQPTPPPVSRAAVSTPVRPGPPVRTESAPRLRQPTPPPATPAPLVRQPTAPVHTWSATLPTTLPATLPVTRQRSTSQTRAAPAPAPAPITRSNSGSRPTPTASGGVSRSNSQTRKSPTSPAVTTPVSASQSRPTRTTPTQSRPSGAAAMPQPVRRGTDPQRTPSTSRPQPTRAPTSSALPTTQATRAPSTPVKPVLPRTQTTPAMSSRPSAQSRHTRSQTTWQVPSSATKATAPTTPVRRDSRSRSQDPANRV